MKLYKYQKDIAREWALAMIWGTPIRTSMLPGRGREHTLRHALRLATKWIKLNIYKRPRV